MFWGSLGAAVATASPALAQAGARLDAAPATPDADALIVTAQRPAVQTLLDRKVYRTSTDLQSTTGTAADILNQIPSVDVDADGAVSLRGDSSVTVLIDGKPSAQFAGATRGLALQQFSARDIDRVEVMTNPPAQYKAEGSGGVINIITRKTTAAGLSGGAQLSGGDSRFVAGANVAYKSGRLSADASFTLRQDSRERRVTDDRAALDPATGDVVRSHETLDERLHRLIPTVKASAAYRLNDHQTLSADYSHRELSGHRVFDQLDSSSPQDGSASSSSERTSDGHEWSVDAGAGLHFEQKLSHPDETITLGLQRSVERERERYAYSNTFTAPAAGESRDRLNLSLDLVTTEVSVDYHLPLPKGRDLTVGYDLELDQNAFDNTAQTIDPSSGALIDNPDVTSHFRYAQQVNAAYGQFATPIGLWNLQAGLRLEQTDVQTHAITGEAYGGQSYLGAYPSAHLERSLPHDQTLRLSLGRRINRPDPEALNPFVDAQDIHNLRAGNPDLKPQETWAYEAGYEAVLGRFNLGATAYLRDNRNVTTDVLQVISADVVLATKANLPKSRAEGLELTAAGKLTSTLSLNLSADIFHSQIDAGALGLPALKATTGVNGKASLEWRATSKDTAQVSLSRTDRRLTPQGYVSAINLVNVGYRRQLRADLALIATVTDLFNSQRFERIITTPTLSETYERHQIGRIAYLGLVYTFGAARKKKASDFEYDQ